MTIGQIVQLAYDGLFWYKSQAESNLLNQNESNEKNPEETVLIRTNHILHF